MHKAKRFAMGGYNDEMNFPDMPPGPGYGGVGLEEMPIYGGPAQLPSGPPKAVSPKMAKQLPQTAQQQRQQKQQEMNAQKERARQMIQQRIDLQQKIKQQNPSARPTPIAPRPQPMPQMPPKDFGEPGVEVGGKGMQSPYVSNGTSDLSGFLKSFLKMQPPKAQPGPGFEPPNNVGMNGPMPTPSMGMQPNTQNTLMPMQQGTNQGMNKPMPTPSANKMGMFKKGGSVKAYASGGSVSASRRGDGCAQRGKTRGTMR